MSTYEVLRPVDQADLDARPNLSGVLGMIPPRGFVRFGRFRHLGMRHASKGLAYARSRGILKLVSPYKRILRLGTVEFWRAQLNKPGHKNTTPGPGIRELYMRALSRFDEWLPGRAFQSYETVLERGVISRRGVKKSFGNVEELMEHCKESDHGTRTARHAARQYLTNLQNGEASASTLATMTSAIKSYFNVNDVALDLPRAGKSRAGLAPDEDSVMTLEDFYKMLQNGRPSIAMRTVMLIKLQSGMDSATLADCFNCEGYPQLVKYFKTADHSSWDLEACPVPIKLVRVKTGVPYTTFLDRDAITQLKEYLTWKEAKHGRQNASEPLFLTKQGCPIHSAWVSQGFSAVAVRAGIQKKISHRVFKVRAHAVRYLLKSTLRTSGCAQYAADHVLGHAPRDSYEKQAILYPEEMRKEYAKASSRINIFSKVENTLNGPQDPESQDARIRDLEAQVRELTVQGRRGPLRRGAQRRHERDV